MDKPNVFNYIHFRSFLKNVYEFHKDNTEGFSLRTLAKEMGLKTHAHFFDVVYGRKLTSKFIPIYCQWLEFNEQEKAYFVAMVDYDQNENYEKQRRAFKKMVQLSPQLESLQMGARSVDFFEKWYQPLLLTLLSLYPKEKEPAVLGKRICPPVSESEIRKALQLLIQFELIRWDQALGQWVLLKRFLQCEDKTQKFALKPYHLKMLELGAFHYQNHYDTQHFASMTLATSQETSLKIKDLIKKCREEITDLVRQDPVEELLLQINFQTFQIVKKK